jgi:hypothetical protein
MKPAIKRQWDWTDAEGKPVSRYRELNEYEFSDLTGIPIVRLREWRLNKDRNGVPYIQRVKGGRVSYQLALYEEHLTKVTKNAS